MLNFKSIAHTHYPSPATLATLIETLFSAMIPLGTEKRPPVQKIIKTLGGEISKALIQQNVNTTPAPPCKGGVKKTLEEGERIARALIDALPSITALVMKDAEAAFLGDPAAKTIVEICLSYPGFRAIRAHRLAHFLYREKVPLIPRMMSEIIHSQTGIDIHPGATIGDSFFIDHGTGVVIGETTIIGPRVKLYQGVTLGALSVHDREQSLSHQRHPTIEEDVTIYSGATILGGKTVIGKGSVIGGNVWLTQSVPPHTKVINPTPYLIYEDLKTGKEIKREEALDQDI